MFDLLYARVKTLAQSPRAEAALAAVAFAESSFFPIPPDVLLAPMALAHPHRAWRFALVATVASVVGGMLGYAIGAVLYDTLGQWLINLYGYAARMDALKATYAEWGWLVILVKGVTPIPYKLVTITSGLLGYNFPLFVALSAVTRGARFFLVAGALHWFGEPVRNAMERNFVAVLGGFAALVIAGFVIASQGLLMQAIGLIFPPSQLGRALWIAGRRAGDSRCGVDLSGLRLCPLRALPHRALRLLRRQRRSRRSPPFSRAARRTARRGRCSCSWR